MSDGKNDRFYVTIINGRKVSRAAGPFPDNDEALSKVAPVRDYVLREYPGAHWWTYGTTRVRPKFGQTLKPGILNHILGVEVVDA